MKARRTRNASAAALAALVAIAVGGMGAAAQDQRPSHPSRPATAKLYGWTQISAKPALSLSEIGLARFGSQLQAVWIGPGSGDTNTLDTRIISATGGVASPAIQVAKWSSLDSFPQVIRFNGGRSIVFAGLRSEVTTDPYTSGTQYYFTSADGRSWTLANAMMSNGKAAYGSYGSDSVDAAGAPVLVYTNGSAASISYHVGAEPLAEPTTSDPTTAVEANADVEDAGDGYDAKSGQVWAVWDSFSGRKTTEGVSAQRLLPTLGSRVHAPKAAVKSTGSYASSGVDQRIDVAPRSAAAGGGLYSSYGVGYPFVTHVALWRLGSSKALIVKSGDDVLVTDAATGPGGRMWVFWYDRGHPVIHAARTNPAATRIGAVCNVTTPHKNTDVYKLAGNGSRGPLQLFINSGPNIDKTQIYAKVVDPCLSVRVAPSSVASGHTVTVTVTDAGTPIAHAKVSLLGTHKRTNRHGVAVFHIGSGTSAGSHVVTVTHRGYQVAQRHVRVRR